ncbi:DUF6318 family protein [Isoptericola halotolerans]|uniref:DUF6318 family protein n=1 Tax=Isoptericola halotolerans TaxID=300560 RepID=UPI00389037A7
MRAHEVSPVRPTGRPPRAAAALVAVATVLVGACAGPTDDGSGPAGTSDGSGDAVDPDAVDPDASDPDAVDPDTPEAAAGAAVDFFAAFDEIVLSGDESHWTDRSSPDCFYCTAMAGFASTFGFGAGAQDARATDAEVTLEELGLAGFDVEVLQVARRDERTVAVDVELEQHLSDHVPVSPRVIGPDGTVDATRAGLGGGSGPQRARVTMTYDGARWTVTDITSVPGGDGARAGAAGAAGATEPAPSAAMSRGAVDGAVAALEHFLALEQFAYRTGEVEELDRMSAPDCAACRTNRDLAVQAFAAGFEIEAGRSRVELVRRVPAEEVLAAEDLDPEMDEDVYLLETRVHTTDTALRTAEGEEVFPAGQYGLRATLLHGPEGRWYVVELTEGP